MIRMKDKWHRKSKGTCECMYDIVKDEHTAQLVPRLLKIFKWVEHHMPDAVSISKGSHS